MSRFIDLTGKKFGRLTVIRTNGKSKSNSILWECVCDCGNTVVVNGIELRCGDTKSCGCLQRETVANMMKTHGLSKTRIYRVWAGIKNRCLNPNASNYKYYGGKGITMCDEWANDFMSFYKWATENGYDENAKAQECTIDRIDTSIGYSPDNCRWANHYTQCNNQTSNKIFEYNGETHTMSEWASIFGIKYTTLRARIRKGLSFEEAIK